MLLRIFSCLTILFLVSARAGGQSDPANFTTVINAPPDAVPNSIGSSTQLNLGPGGIIRVPFVAGNPDGSSSNTEVNIIGGQVADDFSAFNSVVNINSGEAGAYVTATDSIVNIRGGRVGEEVLFPLEGSTFNISGGEILGWFQAFSGSVVTMTGGVIRGGNFGAELRSGSNFEMSGGTISTRVRIGGGSTARFTGGTVAPDFISGSSSEFVGGEFVLNGTPYTDPTITLVNDDVLTGTLADGSPFIFGTWAADRLNGVTLTSTPLPPVDTAPLVVDGASPAQVAGLRAGQKLTLQGSGRLGDNFAVVDATLNIEGGVVGRALEVAGGTINMNGGNVGGTIPGSFGLNAHADSEVNISGGIVVGSLNAYQGSTVNISGGTLSSRLFATEGSVVNLDGGSVGSFSIANANSEINISGGLIEDNFRADRNSVVKITGGNLGNRFLALEGSYVEISGGEFKLNGSALQGTSITLEEGDVFSGTLSDGTVLLFSELAGDALSNVQLKPEIVPAVDTTPIVLQRGVPVFTAGLRAGQQLTLRSGGQIGGDFAALNSTLALNGGIVRGDLEMVESTLRASTGTVEGQIRAYEGSKLLLDGGLYRGEIVAYQGADIDMTHGVFLGGLDLSTGSVANIDGGAIVGPLTVREGGIVNISGGTIDDSLLALAGSEVHLFGTEFYLDNVPIDLPNPGEPILIDERFVTLSGVLADGSHFSIELQNRVTTRLPFVSGLSQLTVTRVPEPGTLVLMGLGYFLLTARVRRSSSWGHLVAH